MRLTPIARGKTKTIYSRPDGTVEIVSRDDITAGDGARHNVMSDKGRLSTRTTSNVFTLLEWHNVPTHYLGPVSDDTFHARGLQMIPLELVVRAIATGSYLKRNPAIPRGALFVEPVFEMFFKDDIGDDGVGTDPYAVFDFEAGTLGLWPADRPLSPEPTVQLPIDVRRFPDFGIETVQRLHDLAVRAFLIVEHAFADNDVILWDFKIECGFDPVTGEIYIGDVIDNDSWRATIGNTDGVSLDKDVYRRLAADLTEDDLKLAFAEIKTNYARIAEITDRFLD